MLVTFRDDPGSKKCIFKRGTKYCEKVMNFSKSATSVMFCGSAAGQLLPPMVVYKATHVYEKWKQGGPKGAVYYCSKNGWFDHFLFWKWFEEVVLPELKRRPGVKLLVGDNLSSHISADVIKACKRNNIRFVCLPPNATHLIQPLDVGVFGPLKTAWRAVLTDYKVKHPREKSIIKSAFPGLLNEMVKRAEPERLMEAAFRKCGLFPINKDEVLDRLPRVGGPATTASRELLDATFSERLNKLRGTDKAADSRQRGKKVPPGKDYTAQPEYESGSEEDINLDDRENEESEVEDSEEELVRPTAKRFHSQMDSSSEDDLDVELEPEPSTSSGKGKGPGKGKSSAKKSQPELASTQPEYPVGYYVVAMYEKQWYIAQVEGEDPEDETPGCTLLKYMARKGDNRFLWSKPDVFKTRNCDILLRTDPPIPVSARGFWGHPRSVVKEIEKLVKGKWSISFILIKNRDRPFYNLRFGRVFNCLNIKFQ